MSNLGTTQAIYEAFGRGDIPFILDQLADDVAWEQWENKIFDSAGKVSSFRHYVDTAKHTEAALGS